MTIQEETLPPIQSMLVDYTFDHEQCNPHRLWSQYDQINHLQKIVI